jgi:hypothetical protein
LCDPQGVITLRRTLLHRFSPIFLFCSQAVPRQALEMPAVQMQKTPAPSAELEPWLSQ